GIARHFAMDARIGPGFPIPDDVEKPDEFIGSLPDDGIAVAVKRSVGEDAWSAPLGLAGLEAKPVDGGVIVVFAAATVVGDDQVAVVKLGDGGGMLVLVWRFRADDFFEARLLGPCVAS